MIGTNANFVPEKNSQFQQSNNEKPGRKKIDRYIYQIFIFLQLCANTNTNPACRYKHKYKHRHLLFCACDSTLVHCVSCHDFPGMIDLTEHTWKGRVYRWYIFTWNSLLSTVLRLLWSVGTMIRSCLDINRGVGGAGEASSTNIIHHHRKYKYKYE